MSRIYLNDMMFGVSGDMEAWKLELMEQEFRKDGDAKYSYRLTKRRGQTSVQEEGVMVIPKKELAKIMAGVISEEGYPNNLRDYIVED